jgi:hypothetical protein
LAPRAVVAASFAAAPPPQASAGRFPPAWPCAATVRTSKSTSDSSRPRRRRSRRACMSWVSASANSTPTRDTWLTCFAPAFSGHAASSRRLGEQFAGPTQPRDHPQILAIRDILETMVGLAVEFSKHQCLFPGICGAHAAENWCGGTHSGVTTGIEVDRIRHVRLSRRDGWSKLYPERERWSVRQCVEVIFEALRHQRKQSFGIAGSGASR